MPEGHTVHRIARDHQRDFAGQRVLLLSPQGRFSEQAASLSGHKLLDVEAWGKHLFYRWTRNRRVHIHLGLYGKFRSHRNPPPEPRGAVRIRLIGADRAFDLNGPNRCELLTPDAYRTLLDRLGPDPLRSDADPEQAWDRMRRSRAPLGTLLLNQSVIAGIGNVYRAEILHLLGIHPERPGRELDRSTFDRLWQLTVDLLQVGVRYNRIITVDRERAGKPLSRLNRGERLVCYKKTSCRDCGGKIRSWTLGARKMYACPRCQT